jgi:hypothetical protein
MRFNVKFQKKIVGLKFSTKLFYIFWSAQIEAEHNQLLEIATAVGSKPGLMADICRLLLLLRLP